MERLNVDLFGKKTLAPATPNPTTPSGPPPRLLSAKTSLQKDVVDAEAVFTAAENTAIADVAAAQSALEMRRTTSNSSKLRKRSLPPNKP